MAAHLVRLKLTLLRNQLRGSIGQVLGLVASVLGGVLLLALVVVGFAYLRTLTVDDAGTWVTVLGAGLVVGWLLSPLGSIGGDQTLDPARFVTFAVPRRRLLTGLLLGGLVGVPAVVTAVAALGTTVVWSRDVISAVVALLGGIVGLLTCLVGGRAAGTVLAVLQGGRRSRELLVSVGLLVVTVASLLPLMLTNGAFHLGVETLRPVARVLGWTPLGWAWSAPWDAASGSTVAAVGKLLLGAALLPLLMRVWGALLDRQLVRPPVSGRATTSGRRGLLTWLPGPTGAVAQRCLTYWRRDPRYALSVVMVVVLPLLGLVLVLAGFMSLEMWALGLAPVIAFFLGWGLHNDLAYDADPWWLHLAAHVPGRVDRAGRVLGSAVWGLPLVVAAAVAGGLLADRGDMVPALVGTGVAVLGAGYGVSSVAAVIAPYWAPAPGENPNAVPPGVGMQLFASQMVTGTATAVAAAPLAVPFVLALTGSAAAAWVTLGGGLALGAALTLAGVAVGGRLLDSRGPEVLARIRR